MLANSCLRFRISFWWSSVRSFSCSSRRSHLNAQTQKTHTHTHVRVWDIINLDKETHAGISKNRSWRRLTPWHLTELMTRPDKITTCLLICWSKWPIRESQQYETGQWDVPCRRRGIYTAYFDRHIQLDEKQHRVRIDTRQTLCMFAWVGFLFK